MQQAPRARAKATFKKTKNKQKKHKKFLLKGNSECTCPQILAPKAKGMSISYPGFLLEDFFLHFWKVFSLLESFWSTESQLPYHEDTQTALWRGPCSGKLRSPGNSLLGTEAT